MYRLILGYLKIVAVIAFVLSLFGVLSFSPLSLLYSFLIVNVVSYAFNLLFGKIFNVQTSTESYAITAYILFLILTPPETWIEALIIALATFMAMASKYLLSFKGRHIFNPAAISLVIIGLLGFGQAIWWVGSAVLLPVTLIGGFLIVRKISRLPLVLSFALVALLEIVVMSVMRGGEFFPSIYVVFASWPLVFFASIMLTEPATMPASRNMQIIYGVIIALIFGSQLSIGPVFASPEVALCIGNIFAYVVSYRPRFRLQLKDKRDLATNIKEFVFSRTDIGDKPFVFEPGQYMEWTHAHPKSDTRGVRRYFTIASSPTEKELKIGIRLQPEKLSTFKNSLLDMKIGEEVFASSLAGDFILPKDKNQKLAFIAGGIGITPFRSMIKFLTDTNDKRDIVLYYLANTESDFAYKDVFAEAEKVGVKTHYLLGRLDKELQETPETLNRHWYISGPNVMVQVYEESLKKIGVPRRSIKKDYFPGF